MYHAHCTVYQCVLSCALYSVSVRLVLRTVQCISVSCALYSVSVHCLVHCQGGIGGDVLGL